MSLLTNFEAERDGEFDWKKKMWQEFNNHELGMAIGFDRNFSFEDHQKALRKLEEIIKNNFQSFLHQDRRLLLERVRGEIEKAMGEIEEQSLFMKEPEFCAKGGRNKIRKIILDLLSE